MKGDTIAHPSLLPQEILKWASPIAQKQLKSLFFQLNIPYFATSPKGELSSSWWQKAWASVYTEKCFWILILKFFYNSTSKIHLTDMEIVKVQKTEIPLKSPLLLSKPETCSRYQNDRQHSFCNVCTHFHVTKSFRAFIRSSLIQSEQAWWDPALLYCKGNVVLAVSDMTVSSSAKPYTAA